MEDIAPLSPQQRPWRWHTYIAMWVASTANPGMYSFGGSLVALGLSPVGGLAVTGIGSAAVAVATALNSAAGVTYGIPFPVYARAAFGLEGAKFAALSRGLVGVMWLSFQMWLSADVLVSGVTRALVPGLRSWAPIWDPYLNGGQLMAFIFVAALHVACVAAGIKHFSRFTYVAAPIGIVFFALIGLWATEPFWEGAGLLKDFEVHSDGAGKGRWGGGWMAMLAGVNSLVSMYSTLMLNMADLARLAPTQKDQALGQLLGIPVPCVLATGVGILGSAAIELKSGKASWQMVDLLQYWPAWASLLGSVTISALAMVVNLSANIIPPANDFMNLWPARLQWRWCAYGTIALAVLICPFYLFHSPTGFAIRFLGGYGIVTGAIYGVMVSDYYLVRGCQLSTSDLYPAGPKEGAFKYRRGHNWRASLATLAGIAMPLPEWLAELLGAEGRPAFFSFCGAASWFVSCAAAAVVYLVACWLSPPRLSIDASTKASSQGAGELSTDASEVESGEGLGSHVSAVPC